MPGEDFAQNSGTDEEVVEATTSSPAERAEQTVEIEVGLAQSSFGGDLREAEAVAMRNVLTFVTGVDQTVEVSETGRATYAAAFENIKSAARDQMSTGASTEVRGMRDPLADRAFVRQETTACLTIPAGLRDVIADKLTSELAANDIDITNVAQVFNMDRYRKGGGDSGLKGLLFRGAGVAA